MRGGQTEEPASLLVSHKQERFNADVDRRFSRKRQSAAR
jgi:hypothetical protein